MTLERSEQDGVVTLRPKDSDRSAYVELIGTIWRSPKVILDLGTFDPFVAVDRRADLEEALRTRDDVSANRVAFLNVTPKFADWLMELIPRRALCVHTMEQARMFAQGDGQLPIELRLHKWHPEYQVLIEYDFTKPSRALIAYGRDGACVLFHAGPHLRTVSPKNLPEAILSQLQRKQYGLWVWEGIFMWDLKSGDSVPEGQLRKLTPREATIYDRGGCPWQRIDWVLPGLTADLTAEEIEDARAIASLGCDDVPPARAETGPLRFGDDWPGLFLRGDTALGYYIALLAIREDPGNIIQGMIVDQFKELLRSVHVDKKPDVQQLHPFQECLSGPSKNPPLRPKRSERLQSQEGKTSQDTPGRCIRGFSKRKDLKMLTLAEITEFNTLWHNPVDEDSEEADDYWTRIRELQSKSCRVLACCTAIQKVPVVRGQVSSEGEWSWFVATDQFALEAAFADNDFNLPEPKHCPFCGTGLPEMQPFPLGAPVCSGDMEHYCNTCKERLRNCRCLPPPAGWVPKPQRS